jgi:2-succinyl-5-enolpyruvyl-6-hydroxy-3-cyclohexene-1-carboxylate synthase
MEPHLNFANTNSLWGSFLVETLHRMGLRRAVVCPGSRSAPLAHALALHPGIEATPVLDERSAAFLALGLARRSGLPVALVCTSGTAAANFYPAIIEARESRVPLLVLTADRPPEMRDCSSGQTIDQVKIFGHYPRLQAELALPEPSLKLLAYLRQTLRHAVERTLSPVEGPVHLNIPFRDPLAPIPDQTTADLDRAGVEALLADLVPVRRSGAAVSPDETVTVAIWMTSAERVLVVAGPASPRDRAAYVEAVLTMAGRTGAPLLADALSPLRHDSRAREQVVECYDCLLASDAVPPGVPDLVLRFGPLPTSKRLRQWLEQLRCPQVVIEEGDQNVDPLHSRCLHLRTSAEALNASLGPAPAPSPSAWQQEWQERNAAARGRLDRELGAMDRLFEGKVPWLLARHLPHGTSVFISNSMPVRDAEFFWTAGAAQVEVFFNRGANGIDGILSTAMGIAMESRATWLVTGELAFLHDQNGLLSAHRMGGPAMTVLVLNNGGGGIFHSLPIAQFDPPFSEFFLTPQRVDISRICQAHNLPHTHVRDWNHFIELMGQEWEGLRVIELRTEALGDRAERTRLLTGK